RRAVHRVEGDCRRLRDHRREVPRGGARARPAIHGAPSEALAGVRGRVRGAPLRRGGAAADALECRRMPATPGFVRRPGAAALLIECSVSALTATAARTQITTASLRTDAAVTPLGIDDPAPRFTWRLTGPGDIRQLSLQVLVASRADLLRPGAADVWDSGEVKSSDPACLYAGPGLRAHTRYFWTVRVVTNASDGWAEPSWFETGLLSAADWKGPWIAGPERRGQLADAEGIADDAEIRAADEFCRPVSWLM